MSASIADKHKTPHTIAASHIQYEYEFPLGDQTSFRLLCSVDNLPLIQAFTVSMFCSQQVLVNSHIYCVTKGAAYHNLHVSLKQPFL